MKKTLNVFGPIGEDIWTDSGLTVAKVHAALDGMTTEDELELYINSPGGSIIEGLAIANTLISAKPMVHAIVVGMAASMASVIICACDKVTMKKNSYVFMHNPWMYTMGNADSLQKDIDMLNSMKEQILDFYVRYAPNVKREDISAKMNEEVWMDSSATTAFGFKFGVDEHVMDVAACVGIWNFMNMPDTVKAIYKQVDNKQPANPPAGSPPPSAAVTPPVTVLEPAPPSPHEGGGTAGVTALVCGLSAEQVQALIEADKAHKTRILCLEGQLTTVGNQAQAFQSRYDKLTAEHAVAVAEFDRIKNDLTTQIKNKDTEIGELKTQFGMVAVGAFGLPPTEASVNAGSTAWDKALEACNGNYVQARKKFPEAWLSSVTIRKSK